MIDVAGVINWKTFSGLKQCSADREGRREGKREAKREAKREKKAEEGKTRGEREAAKRSHSLLLLSECFINTDIPAAACNNNTY